MIRASVALLWVLFLPLAQAQEGSARFELMDSKGRPVSRYNQTVQELVKHLQVHPGEVHRVGLGPGREQPVTRYLGMGSQSVILETSDGRILRIRKLRRTLNPLAALLPNPDLSQYVDGVGSYLRGYRDLIEHGVPVPRIFLTETDGEYWLISEKVDFEFKYGNYLMEMREGEPIPASVLKTMDEALIVFARKTAAFRHIGDFRDAQLVFSGGAWVLIDWDEGHVLGHGDLGGRGNVFEMETVDRMMNQYVAPGEIRVPVMKPGLPDRMVEPVRKAIAEERARMRAAEAAAREAAPPGKSLLRKGCDFLLRFTRGIFKG